jgi:hypothetical protein
VAGATALALAGKHSIHRTTVLGLLERHQVPRRGQVMTPDHFERAVTLHASGLSRASIGKELNVNPETVRQALFKAGVAMRRPGRRSDKREPWDTSIGDTAASGRRRHSSTRPPPGMFRRCQPI